MSWDLDIGDWEGNYTHNTNHMIRSASVPEWVVEDVSVAEEVLFRKPVGGLCWGDFDGKPGKHVSVFCAEILTELEANPEKYIAMNPPNGWGSYDTLIDFIRGVKAACDRFPTETFEARG